MGESVTWYIRKEEEMSFMRTRTRILATVALPVFLLTPASATAQEEEEVLMRPVPAGVFSESIVTVAYIPLADVSRSLGARLQFDSNRNAYTAQPDERGVLRVNPEHVMGVVIEEQPNLLIGAERMGIIIEERPAPEGDSERLAQADRLSSPSRRPSSSTFISSAYRPAATAIAAAGEPGTLKAQTLSFEIGGHLVSRGIIIVGGRPYMPLDDFAAAMGVKVEERAGRSGSIYMFNPQPDPLGKPLLGLTERGIIIIDSHQ